ncbi:MAG: Xaa-Pro peptidase family protein [Elusimicrobiota bacterium]
MKQNRINNIISDLPVPAYLVTDKHDLFYLTGVELDGFWLLLTKNGFTAFTSPMFAEQLSELLPGENVISGKMLLNLLEAYCAKNRVKTIGVDYEKTNLFLAKGLEKIAPLEDTRNLVMRYRQIKGREEIELVKRSCKIAVSALKFARKFIKPGMSEIEMMFKIEEYFAKRHAKPAFPTIVASGPNSANPHHISSARKIKRNDVVLVDLGCVKNGYCSDLTRTFILGKIRNPFKEIKALVREARDQAVKRVKDGALASDIDSTARKIISDGGYADYFIHTTGHGLGIEVHEPPRLSAADATVLRTGMFVTVEPGIYLPGKFGVRHEDLLLVKEKGNEVMTDDFNG